MARATDVTIAVPTVEEAMGFHYSAEGQPLHRLNECRPGTCWTDEVTRMGGQQDRVCRYERPATYGQFLDGNPCAGCGRSEADHLTAYVVPLEPARGLTGYLVVYALSAADAEAIGRRKNYPVVGPVREATEADDKPLKTLRPWS